MNDYSFLKNYPLRTLELSVRATNALIRWRPEGTLYDIWKMTDEEVLAIPKFGKTCLKEIRQVLSTLTNGVQTATVPADLVEFCANNVYILRALRDGNASVNISLKQDTIQ